MELPRSSEEQLNEREVIWNRALLALRQETDGMGRPLDPDIFETVAAFNVHGYRTVGSCAGHIEKENPRFPYLRIDAPNEPREKYVGEIVLRMEIAKKYGIPPDEVSGFDDEGAEQEYEQRLGNSPRWTEAYRLWVLENDHIAEEIQILIQDFAQETRTYNGTIGISRIGNTVFLRTVDLNRLTCISKEQMQQEIPIAQSDMFSFGTWLKQRYINGDKL